MGRLTASTVGIAVETLMLQSTSNDWQVVMCLLGLTVSITAWWQLTSPLLDRWVGITADPE